MDTLFSARKSIWAPISYDFRKFFISVWLRWYLSVHRKLSLWCLKRDQVLSWWVALWNRKGLAPSCSSSSGTGPLTWGVSKPPLRAFESLHCLRPLSSRWLLPKMPTWQLILPGWVPILSQMWLTSALYLPLAVKGSHCFSCPWWYRTFLTEFLLQGQELAMNQMCVWGKYPHLKISWKKAFITLVISVVSYCVSLFWTVLSFPSTLYLCIFILPELFSPWTVIKWPCNFFLMN